MIDKKAEQELLRLIGIDLPMTVIQGFIDGTLVGDITKLEQNSRSAGIAKVDLSAVPYADLASELARRNSRRRKRTTAKIEPCPVCQTPLNARQRRKACLSCNFSPSKRATAARLIARVVEIT